MKRSGAALLVVLMLLLAGALAVKGQPIAPPPAEQAGPGQFDAARAATRLARVLGDQRPHPVDTEADDAVRARLVAELQAIGLAPRVTDDWACGGGKAGRYAACARVRNVVATIGDPAAPGQVLLASHYDSTAAGPGAADDGIGVATMLEIASLLKGRKLAHPVTLLFDEGEEAGLLGAHAFLEHDPLAGRIASLVNFEARGVTGPATMFETSRPNGAAIAAFKAAAVRPVANSLTADFYQLIPNSTDVTVWAAARPWTILNFAVIGNESRYHSRGDRVEALDRASLQHMGRQGLAAALRLADGPAPATGGERIYADVAGRVLVVLPRTLGLAAFALLLVGTAGFAWTRRQGLARGAGAVLAAVAGSALLVWLLQWAVEIVRPGPFWRAHPDILALAVDVATLAVAAAALAGIGRGLTREGLRAAFWLVFMLLNLVIVAVAPGAAIFALLPPLLMLLGWVAGQRARRAETVAAVLAWAALFATWAPLVHLSEVLLDFGAAWLFAPFAALLVLPALIELEPLAGAGGRRIAVAVAALGAAAAWGAVLAVPAYSADRKQNVRIDYAWDAEAQKGQWLVANGGAPLPDDFPGAAAFRRGARLPWSPAGRWGAPAPALPLPAPRLDKVGERAAPGGGRVATLRIAMNGAEDLIVYVDAKSDVRAAGTAGSTVRFGAGAGKEPTYVRCTGRSCDGATIDLALGGKPVEAIVVGVRNALPAAAAPLVRARPATAQPQYSPDTSVTWTKATL
ncbi:MAG: M28 family peptidase [Alphaproteobacteria bacterium]|nr:M28 family peptidase [Alphaproteobacteria bacterium]